MATKLNQILAVEKGAKSAGSSALTGAYHLIQKSQLLAGLSRTYRPRDDEGEQLPPEFTNVQVTADAVLTDAVRALTRMWDVTATKDWANTRAQADVVVDGDVLLDGVPVTYLLYLEKQLADFITFLRKLPTLDPAEVWTFDEASGAYRTVGIQKFKNDRSLSDEEIETIVRWVDQGAPKGDAKDKPPAKVWPSEQGMRLLPGQWLFGEKSLSDQLALLD